MSSREVGEALAELGARICDARFAALVPSSGDPWCFAIPPFVLRDVVRCAAVSSRFTDQETCIVPDVRADGRFRGLEVVNDAPPMQFLAMLSVHGPDAQPLGRLFVADDGPRDLNASHRFALRLVARIASTVLSAESEPLPAWLFDLLDNAPVGVHSIDGTGTIQWMNQTELRWLGYTRAELVGKLTMRDLVPPAQLDGFRRSLLSVMSTGRSDVPDAELRCRDGRSLPVHIVANDVRGADGAMLRTRSIVVDRSESVGRGLVGGLFRQSEQERLHQRLADSLDAVTAAGWYLDLATGVLNAHGGLSSALGGNATEERSLETFRSRVHPDDAPSVEAALERARHERTEYRHIHRLRRADGSVVWVASRGRFRFDDQGSPRSLIGVTVAIDDLQPHGGFTLFENISDGCVVLDELWRFTFVNRRAAEILGRAPEALVGRVVWDEIPEAIGGAFQRTFERAQAERIPLRIEDYFEPWGRWFETRVHPLPDGRLAIFFTDVTERHVREQERDETAHRLRLLTERLLAVREEEATRLSREVHDGLGQTLTALKLDLVALARQLDGVAGDASAARARLGSATALVDELFASVRRMASEIRPSMLEDLGLAATIQWYVRERATRSGLECELLLDESEPGPPRATSIALYRVLQECVTNVIRHARATRIVIRLARHADEVELSVEDNGIGVSADQVSKRSGLGLLGSRERMALVGGSFAIAPAPDGGTIATARAPWPREPT